jgi:hypothetical protein
MRPAITHLMSYLAGVLCLMDGPGIVGRYWVASIVLAAVVGAVYVQRTPSTDGAGKETSEP